MEEFFAEFGITIIIHFILHVIIFGCEQSLRHRLSLWDCQVCGLIFCACICVCLFVCVCGCVCVCVSVVCSPGGSSMEWQGWDV